MIRRKTDKSLSHRVERARESWEPFAPAPVSMDKNVKFTEERKSIFIFEEWDKQKRCAAICNLICNKR